ncbi:MAG: hypothetical protein EB059_09245 [Alphaproteobacteria bacterium]|nr:hypothetical protein [Alphaproteobacteria bacterium]
MLHPALLRKRSVRDFSDLKQPVQVTDEVELAFQATGQLQVVRSKIQNEIPRIFPEQASVFVKAFDDLVTDHAIDNKARHLDVMVSDAEGFSEAPEGAQRVTHNGTSVFVYVASVENFDTRGQTELMLKRLEYMQALLVMLSTTDQAGSSQVLGKEMGRQSAVVMQIKQLNAKIDTIKVGLKSQLDGKANSVNVAQQVQALAKDIAKIQASATSPLVKQTLAAMLKSVQSMATDFPALKTMTGPAQVVSLKSAPVAAAQNNLKNNVKANSVKEGPQKAQAEGKNLFTVKPALKTVLQAKHGNENKAVVTPANRAQLVAGQQQKTALQNTTKNTVQNKLHTKTSVAPVALRSAVSQRYQATATPARLPSAFQRMAALPAAQQRITPQAVTPKAATPAVATPAVAKSPATLRSAPVANVSATANSSPSVFARAISANITPAAAQQTATVTSFQPAATTAPATVTVTASELVVSQPVASKPAAIRLADTQPANVEPVSQPVVPLVTVAPVNAAPQTAPVNAQAAQPTVAQPAAPVATTPTVTTTITTPSSQVATGSPTVTTTATPTAVTPAIVTVAPTAATPAAATPTATTAAPTGNPAQPTGAGQPVVEAKAQAQADPTGKAEAKTNQPTDPQAKDIEAKRPNARQLPGDEADKKDDIKKQFKDNKISTCDNCANKGAGCATCGVNTATLFGVKITNIPFIKNIPQDVVNKVKKMFGINAGACASCGNAGAGCATCGAARVTVDTSQNRFQRKAPGAAPTLSPSPTS